MIDKNQSIIDYLLNCPQLKDNPLFFNFAEAKDNTKQIVVSANDKAVSKEYIDGSISKRYTFTIIDYRSISYQALVTQMGLSNENVDEILDVQGIIDWISEQNDNKNYPDFGKDCMIENISALSDNPNLNGVDTSVKPALAKYSIAIQIDYIDNSKCIWNNT